MEQVYPSKPILIVDDEPKALSSMDTVLKMNGVDNTITCGDGQTAKNYIEKGEFSVVLLDLTMPNISGLDLLPFVSRLHPDTPVIVATAQNNFRSAANCMKLGAHDYLIKPIDKDKFILSVRRSIEFGNAKRENAILKELLLSDNFITTDNRSVKDNDSLDFLIQARNEYKSLFETILTPSFVIDTASDVCRYSNHAYSEFMAKHNGEYGGQKGFINLLHDDDRTRLLERCRKQGKVIGKEVRGRFVNGVEFTIVISCRLSAGESILQGNFLDITDQTNFAERYRKVRHLDRLGGVISEVTHDLRDALAGITGYADLIMADLAEPDGPAADTTEQSLANLQQITMLTERASLLTETLLLGREPRPAESKRN